jgi:hypothetical protein
MSYWVEVHCDVRKDGQHPTNPCRPRCRTHENENPALMVPNLEQVSLVRQRALDRGWVRRGRRWVCPGCQ